MTKKNGRPTKLTEKTTEILCKAIRLGATYEHACNAAGLSYNTFNEWRKAGENATSGKYRDFYDTIKKAEGDAVQTWLTQIENAAQEGNWTAAAWKLERRYFSDYGKQVKKKVEQVNIDLSTLTDEQLQRLANGEDIASVLSDSSEG